MKVLVAMSGGVDSSVVAALLHEAGEEVIGATLQLYDHGAAVARSGSCCAGQDIHDARRVADMLGIPHYVLDREARFRNAVIQPFADSYAKGETPVPCIACNQSVKFQDLVTLARDLGCDALATGHYARRVDGPGGPELHRARDAARDQSWFLAATTRPQLASSRFPLGDYPDKAAVRAAAARLGVLVAEKPDSQDLCFVPSGNYHELVARLRPDAAEAGDIVDETGAVIGRHAGIGRYTVGQGRGLGAIGGRRVAAIDAGRRRVVVSHAVGLAEVVAGAVNWLVAPFTTPVRCTVKLRGRESPAPCEARWDAATGLLLVRPDAPAIAAPGQACVLYDGDRVLAGGFIRADGFVDRGRGAAYAPAPGLAA